MLFVAEQSLPSSAASLVSSAVEIELGTNGHALAKPARVARATAAEQITWTQWRTLVRMPARQASGRLAPQTLRHLSLVLFPILFRFGIRAERKNNLHRRAKLFVPANLLIFAFGRQKIGLQSRRFCRSVLLAALSQRRGCNEDNRKIIYKLTNRDHFSFCPKNGSEGRNSTSQQDRRNLSERTIRLGERCQFVS